MTCRVPTWKAARASANAASAPVSPTRPGWIAGSAAAMACGVSRAGSMVMITACTGAAGPSGSSAAAMRGSATEQIASQLAQPKNSGTVRPRKLSAVWRKPNWSTRSKRAVISTGKGVAAGPGAAAGADQQIVEPVPLAQLAADRHARALRV
jgi:hypothetical protein